MANRLGYVFLVILALAVLNYAGTEFSRAFASYSFAAQSSPMEMYGAVRGLASIDFDNFTKNGSGWNDITQGYGVTPLSSWYVGHWHNGVDIAAQYGAPIYSPNVGVVLATGNQDNYCPGRGFGKFVAVSDVADDVVLWYAHLGQIDVSAGQAISRGTAIGTIGTTGLETGTHLHFSVFKAEDFSMENKNGCGPDANGKDANPVPYLQKFSGAQ